MEQMRIMFSGYISFVGDIVLDPFLGTGTITATAALVAGRPPCPASAVNNEIRPISNGINRGIRIGYL